MDIIEVLKMVFGSFFVLFVPGFSWSFLFFKRGEIDGIERIALSFGLSIAIVPLMIFYLNYLLGVKITILSSTFAILLLTLIPAAIYYAKKRGLVPDKLTDLTKLWRS